MTHGSTIVVLNLAAAGLLFFGSAVHADTGSNEEDEFPFAQAPAAVQATMKRVAGSAVPDELDKTIENGAVVYQGEYRTSSGENSITVAENGDLLEVKKEVAAAALPAAVKATVARSFSGAPVKRAHEVYLKGATSPGYYEVKMAGAQKKRIKVRPTGDLVT